MATDKTMPPNDPTESSPAMPGEMGATASMGDAPMPQGGDVMISMPKSAFDAMQQIVQSLAQGLSQLAKDVDSQAKGGAQGGQGEMEASREAEMPGGAASSEDEEFLKGLTEEGNSKTR